MTLQDWLNHAAEQFTMVSETPKLDAETLLTHTLEKNRAYLYAHGDELLSSQILSQLTFFYEKRISGMPLAYVIGEKEFWSLSFKVSSDVLIPRPETEHLVEIALEVLDGRKIPPGPPLEKGGNTREDLVKARNVVTHVSKTETHVLELGTGSGAISIALAKERPDWHIFACDNSPNALKIAEENAHRLLTENHQLLFQYSHWFQQIPKKKFSAIIANPPYIKINDPHLQNLSFEPLNALVSGPDGLQDIREIIEQSPDFLSPHGYVFLEHGYTQAQDVRTLFQSAGFSGIETCTDLSGNDRITFAFWI